MIRYSFTGPSRLTADERTVARAVVAALDDASEFTTGAAAGWDVAVAAAAVDLWPRAHHRIVVPNAPYDEQAVAEILIDARRRGVTVEVIHARPVPGSRSDRYRERNRQLVSFGDRLVAAVHGRAYYRSGEWMTVRIAQAASVPVQFVDLTDPTVPSSPTDPRGGSPGRPQTRVPSHDRKEPEMARRRTDQQESQAAPESNGGPALMDALVAQVKEASKGAKAAKMPSYVRMTTSAGKTLAFLHNPSRKGVRVHVPLADGGYEKVMVADEAGIAAALGKVNERIAALAK